MKKIVLFFALAFTAMPGGVSVASGSTPVPAGTATGTIVPSVVHAESVFDTLYPVFRQLFGTFDGMQAHQANKVNRSRDRHFGYVTGPRIYSSSPRAMSSSTYYQGWTSTSDPGFVLDINRELSIFQMYSEEIERASRICVDTILLPALEAVTGREGYSAETEKARMVRELEAFGDTALTLPTVYALIATKYGGDVRAYVDDLFGRSVMTSRRRLRRFVRSPITKRMREDMGFQFVVSKLMYRLWEAQGRPAQPAADGSRLVILRSELP